MNDHRENYIMSTNQSTCLITIITMNILVKLYKLIGFVHWKWYTDYIMYRIIIFFQVRQLSLYCLVDEVPQCGEIMPDEKKIDI